MIFKPLKLQDIEIVRPFLDSVNARTCDFTVGGMFMWRDYYKIEYALENDAMFSRLYNSDGKTYYNVPASEDPGKGVSYLLKTHAEPIAFCTVPEPFLGFFAGTGRETVITEQTDYADYLYRADDLIRYPGKKYHGQRNLINRFIGEYENWSYDVIGGNDVSRVRDFFFGTYLPSAGSSPTEIEENIKVAEVLDNYDAYGFVGGVLTVDGTVVGFSLNEIIGDTLYTHVEKADRSFIGVYQMLASRSAAALTGDAVQYVNREEDMGDEGLRRSKESYHPVKLLKKYIVEVY